VTSCGDRRSRVTRGVDEGIDPATSREINVESGLNYYWIDHPGVVVGEETDTKAALDFRCLVRLP